MSRAMHRTRRRQAAGWAGVCLTRVAAVLVCTLGLAAGCDRTPGAGGQRAADVPPVDRPSPVAENRDPTDDMHTPAAVAPPTVETSTASPRGDDLAWDGVKLVLPDSEWRRRLTPEQYRILRGSGTEACFTGPYHDHKGRTGMFVCAGCELPLFAGAAKFDSGTGWPSFFQPVHPRNVGRKLDLSYGMVRIEVFCNRCDGHLGHVFEDGPPPTGLRYCINGYAIKLIEDPSPAGR